MTNLVKLAPQLLAELSELIPQLHKIAELIQLIELLAELLAKLRQTVPYLIEILVIELTELVPDLLATLGQLVAQLAEVAALMELAEQLAQITKPVEPASAS